MLTYLPQYSRLPAKIIIFSNKQLHIATIQYINTYIQIYTI